MVGRESDGSRLERPKKRLGKGDLRHGDGFVAVGRWL